VTYIPSKEVRLEPMRMSLDDVATVYKRLGALLSEQADKEVASLQKATNQTDADLERQKANAHAQAFKITVTIAGPNGQSLYGEDVAVFESPSRPDKINLIYMTNITAYQRFTGHRPANSFELWFDFSKPPLLDASSPVSAPTPNGSLLKISGMTETWVAAVADAVLGITGARKVPEAWMHKAFAYDAGLVTVALPFAFYLCWRASSFISSRLAVIHPVVSGAAFVYVFFLSLMLYRMLFGYAKWAFPKVELTNNNDTARRHRAILFVIVTGLLVNVVWEFRRLLGP